MTKRQVGRYKLPRKRCLKAPQIMFFFVNGQGLSEIHPNQCPSHKDTPHLSRIAFSEDQGALGFFLSSTWEMIIWTVLRHFARVCLIFCPIHPAACIFTNTFDLLFDVWKQFLEHILQNGGALMVMISMVHHGTIRQKSNKNTSNP